jgi:hypothetical protein
MQDDANSLCLHSERSRFGPEANEYVPIEKSITLLGVAEPGTKGVQPRGSRGIIGLQGRST